MLFDTSRAPRRREGARRGERRGGHAALLRACVRARACLLVSQMPRMSFMEEQTPLERAERTSAQAARESKSDSSSKSVGYHHPSRGRQK